MLTVGTVTKFAVPVVVPATAFTIEDKLTVKCLPPPTSWVVMLGKVNAVAPAAMVAVPLNEV